MTEAPKRRRPIGLERMTRQIRVTLPVEVDERLSSLSDRYNVAAGTIARAAIEAGAVLDKAASRKGGRYGRATAPRRTRPPEGNARLRCACGDGRRQETGSVRRVVRRALDDFCSGPLFLTCNALGQTAVMPGHLVEYNSSIAGEE